MCKKYFASLLFSIKSNILIKVLDLFKKGYLKKHSKNDKIISKLEVIKNILRVF